VPDHEAQIVDVEVERRYMRGNAAGVPVSAEIEEVRFEIVRHQPLDELGVTAGVLRVSTIKAWHITQRDGTQ